MLATTPDRVIGNYRLIAPLGTGGMGFVYRAQHLSLGHEIAIKLLRPEYTTQPEVVQRFLLEAKAASEIRHENAIEVFDAGTTPEGEHYLLMEYLVGCTLTEAVRVCTPFSPQRLGHVGLQVCSALSAVHDKGIVH